MSEKHLAFSILENMVGICKLDVNAMIPTWAYRGNFFSVTKTPEELSIVCSETAIPANVLCEKSWKVLKIQGPLDFGLVGVLAKISSSLARAGVSIFAISTYNTDYILVREAFLNTALHALKQEGHKFEQ